MTNQLDSAVHRAVADILDTAPATPDAPIDPSLIPDSGSSTGRHALLVAAAAVATIGIAGLIVAQIRSDDVTPASQPTVGPTAPPAASPATGRLVLDPPPPGLSLRYAQETRFTGTGDSPARIYVTDRVAPERAPAVIVQTVAADDAEPYDAQAEAVDVHGITGHLSATTSTGTVLTVTFGPVDGLHYRLTGFNIDRDAFLRFADTAAPSPDGVGGVIDTTAGPAGLIDVAVGDHVESWFVPRSDVQMPSPTALWSDDANRSIWYMTIEQDPSLLGISRLGYSGYDTVTDITINGHTGYIAAGTPGTPSGGLLTIGWSDGNRTVLLAARGFTPTEAAQLAEQLRPATDAEWQQMTGTTPQAPGPDATPTTSILAG